MEESNTLWALVVLGRMNPAIHHPAWYAKLDLLLEHEERAAAEQNLICTPALSHFDVGRFAIVCQPTRWEVQSRTEGTPAAVFVAVAQAVFAALKHTPVSAWGLNLTRQIETGQSHVGKFLGRRVSQLPFGIEASDDQILGGSVRLTRGSLARRVAIAVDSSMLSQFHASVAVNVHHDLADGADVADAIGVDAPHDCTEALAIVDSVSGALKTEAVS